MAPTPFPLVQILTKKMEGELLKILLPSLTLATRGDKTKVELNPPVPASPGSTATSSLTSPAPGGGHRRQKGAAAMAKANARAALHRVNQAAATPTPPAAGDASATLEAPSPFPLALSATFPRHLLRVGRLEVPTFTNLDGALPSPPPCPPLE